MTSVRESSPEESPPPQRKSRQSPLAWSAAKVIALVGVLCAGVGVFLPWASVDVFIASVDFRGSQITEGRLALVCVIASALVLFLARGPRVLVLAIVFSLIAGAACIHVIDTLASFAAVDGVAIGTVSMGPGLELSIAGVVVSIGATGFLMTRLREDRLSSATDDAQGWDAPGWDVAAGAQADWEPMEPGGDHSASADDAAPVSALTAAGYAAAVADDGTSGSPGLDPGTGDPVAQGSASPSPEQRNRRRVIWPWLSLTPIPPGLLGVPVVYAGIRARRPMWSVLGAVWGLGIVASLGVASTGGATQQLAAWLLVIGWVGVIATSLGLRAAYAGIMSHPDHAPTGPADRDGPTPATSAPSGAIASDGGQNAPAVPAGATGDGHRPRMPLADVYLGLDGRIGRSAYWLAILPLNVVTNGLVGALIRAIQVGSLGIAIGSAIALVVVAWPTVCITGKRFHDRDKSAWWCLVYLAPIAGAVWLVIDCGCIPGDVGGNRFGSATAKTRYG